MEKLADSHRATYANTSSFFILCHLCIILSCFSLFFIQTLPFLYREFFLGRGVFFLEVMFAFLFPC